MLTSVVFAVHNLRRGHRSPEDSGLTCIARRAIAVPSQNSLATGCSLLTAGFLIANPRLKSELSANDPNRLQISNRERMAICRLIPPFHSPGVGLVVPSFSSSLHPPASSLQNLIVTLRLKSPATPTKQNSNPISNRYKSPFSRSSPITRHSSRLTVAPTPRKAIMCRNHFTQIPRSSLSCGR